MGRKAIVGRNDRQAAAGISRRALCFGTTSLFALGLSGPAFGSDLEVRDAIVEDFGVSDLPDGDIQIDMPEFSDTGKSVPLSFTVPCSMQGLDYPEVVAIYAARNPRPRIAKIYFTPFCSEATFATRVRIDSYQDITFVVKMATGEIFKRVRNVDVTYGACESAVANDQFPPGWAPSIRIAAPDTAKAGEAIEIRTIIGHPMETGFRYDSSGLTVPVRIVEQFRCLANDELALSVDLEPAISANPYFAFGLRLEETTQLRLVWVDTSTDVYSDETTIVVSQA